MVVNDSYMVRHCPDTNSNRRSSVFVSDGALLSVTLSTTTRVALPSCACVGDALTTGTVVCVAICDRDRWFEWRDVG